jgi:hypothetical protein
MACNLNQSKVTEIVCNALSQLVHKPVDALTEFKTIGDPDGEVRSAWYDATDQDLPEGCKLKSELRADFMDLDHKVVYEIVDIVCESLGVKADSARALQRLINRSADQLSKSTLSKEAAAYLLGYRDAVLHITEVILGPDSK